MIQKQVQPPPPAEDPDEDLGEDPGADLGTNLGTNLGMDLGENRVTALADRLSRTLGVACALAETGRRIDLSGIEDGVGLLCAQTLDLPRALAHRMVPVLREVLSRVDRLTLLLERG